MADFIPPYTIRDCPMQCGRKIPTVTDDGKPMSKTNHERKMTCGDEICAAKSKAESRARKRKKAWAEPADLIERFYLGILNTTTG